MRQVYNIGALYRGAFRRSLQAANIQYVEDTALLDSQFVVEASEKQHSIMCRFIEQISLEDACKYFDYKINNAAADEFADYLDKFPEATYSKKKGWFKTKFTVFCHPNLAAKFKNSQIAFNL